MKHCVQYPDDKFFAVRPCLVGICLGNRAAGKLLGALLYRYNLRVENKDDAENQNAVKAAQGKRPDQDTSYRIFRKQSQLVEDMCGEIDEKTLHNVAVPMLQILGFLDIEEHVQTNCYIVDVDLIQQALDLYIPGHKQQPACLAFIKEHGQLEKFLISPDQLENFLIDRKTFLSGLENVLIANRKFSNCKRGRKPRPKADAEAISQLPQNTKEESKNTREETRVYASAIAPATHTPFSSSQQESEVYDKSVQLQAEPIRLATSEQDEKAGQHGQRIAPKASVAEQEDSRAGENNSHSQSEITQENRVGAAIGERADAIPATEQKQAPKPQRKPKVLKDMPTAEQIEQVIVCMEQTIRRLTEQEDYTFGRSGKAKAAVKELLTGPGGTVRRITREKLEWEITKLYHRPKDPRTGFLWADNLSVPAICNNYDKETMDYRPGGIAQIQSITNEPPRSTFVPRPSKIQVPDDFAEAYAANYGGR